MMITEMQSALTAADAAAALKESPRIIPLIYVGLNLFDTMESCRLANCGRDIWEPVEKVYPALTDQTKSILTADHEDGEFLKRAQMWRKILIATLPREGYHKAMAAILRWYIRLKQTRKEN